MTMTSDERFRFALPGGNREWVTWLHAYDLPSLQTLCRARGIPVREGMTKATLTRLLAAELPRSSVLRSLLSDLQPSERAWLGLFGRNGGVLRESDVRRGRTECPEAGLRRLAARGLVLPGPFDGHIPHSTFDVSSPAGPLWCPRAVLDLFAGENPQPKLIPYRGEVEHVALADFRILEHDLVTLADQLRQAPVRKLKSGFPGKRFLSRVAQRFQQPVDRATLTRMETSGRILFVYDLLDGMGIVRSRHDRITTSPVAEEFFTKPPPERVTQVFERWQQLLNYNEMYRIPELVFERGFPDYEMGDGKADDLPTAERLVEARQFVVSLCRGMPPGEWVRLDELIAAAYLLDDAFLVKPPRSYYYAHAPIYLGVLPTDDSQATGFWSWGLERAGNWSLVEGRFIREVFAGSLHALGLVDAARTPDGSPLFRMNELGRWLIAEGPEPQLALPPKNALVVQPNFDIVVFPEGQDVSLLWPLLQATEVISRDVTLTLRLTADSIHRASHQNISAESVLSLLERHAHGPIPENVRQAMEDWEHRHQQVAITTLVDLVEAESGERFARLLEEINADQMVLRPLSDTVGVVIGPTSRLPQMTSFDYLEPLPPSIRVSPDLDVTIDPARENWLIRPRLSAIADEAGIHTYHITRESVLRGINKGYYYDEALDLLRLSTIGGLPTRAAFKLRGFFGHLGPASVGEVTLIQMARESVLTTMLETEDFRELIIQRLGPTTALVVGERVGDLLAKLEEFGIPNDAGGLTDVRLAPVRRSAAEEDAPPSEVRPQRLQTYSTRKTRELLEDAIRQGRRVRIRYRPHAGGRGQERTIDPIDVQRRHGVAYLTAYCHLRGEVQAFRIPSIVALELLDTPVSPR